MKKLMCWLVIVSFGMSIVGCGGETAKKEDPKSKKAVKTAPSKKKKNNK